jgi:hypothetical protein
MAATRHLSRQFKLEAVKLVEERGVSVRQAPRIQMYTRMCYASRCASIVSNLRKHSQATAK